jgi:hypothetical protein
LDELVAYKRLVGRPTDWQDADAITSGIGITGA